MNNNSELVLELWENLKDASPPAKREDALNKMLKILENFGIDLEEVGAELHGEDKMLDAALSDYYEPEPAYDEDEEY